MSVITHRKRFVGWLSISAVAGMMGTLLTFTNLGDSWLTWCLVVITLSTAIVGCREGLIMRREQDR